MIRLSALAGLLLLVAAVQAQPQFVAELNPGEASSSPRDLRVFNRQLFFTATRADVGREVFHYNGRYAALATDLDEAQAMSSSPSTYVVHRGALYFNALESSGHHGLWRFDGRATDLIWGGSVVSAPVSYNGRLYFVAFVPEGPRLWYWDGHDNYLVDALPPSPYPANHLTVFQNRLYFSFNDGAGRELWRFDGHRAERVTELNPSDQERGERGVPIDFRTLRAYQGRLYFTAPDRNLYRFDGSTATRVFARERRAEWAGAHGGLVFLRTLRQVTINGYVSDTLWAFDGTQPRPLLPLFGPTRVEVGYDRQEFVPFRGALYYRSQYHLWRLNDDHFERVSNESLLTDFLDGTLMAPYRGQLYVALPHLTDGNDELYRYDGAGPVYERIAALTPVSFDAPLLNAEAAELEAGLDLAVPTAAVPASTPAVFEAMLASGNPTSGAVQVRLTLPEAAAVRATVHDVLGRAVATLADGPLPGGPTTLTWEGADAVPGVYTVRVAAGRAVRTVSVVRAR